MTTAITSPARKATTAALLNAPAQRPRLASGGSPSGAEERHGVHVWSWSSAWRLSGAIALALLAGCGRESDLPPLPPASLDRSQVEALQRMNSAGATAFAGWTWRYEFGAGCRLRVVKRYEDRPIPMTEYVLADHRVEVIPYPG